MSPNSGQKRFKARSYDSRRISDDYEIEDLFDLEFALNTAYSQNIKQLARKRNIAAAISMAKNGFFKNIVPRIGIDFTNINVKRVYTLLTNMYLDKDFQFDDIMAMADIATFDSVTILRTCDSLKVKNLWYLRKVLLSNNNRSDYTMVDEIDIKTGKGKKIKTEFMDNYAE